MIEHLVLAAWPRSAPSLSILIYHRVLQERDPMRPGEIDADVFERQMRFVARHFEVLGLPDAAARLREGRLARRTCCITFDDGYADNHAVAAPILRRAGLTATFFVSTGFLDGGTMFNDRVIDCVARAKGPWLDLSPIGLGRHAISDVAGRRAAVASVLGTVRYRPLAEREALVGEMLALAGVQRPEQGMMMSSRQVRELADAGFDIGGHTVNHPILTTVPVEHARKEIQDGKSRLEAITGARLRSFAYPNGRPGRDYGPEHVALVREAGFDVAVSTAHGVARADDDILQLPRFTSWGRSLAMFSARLTRNARLGAPASTCA